MDNISEHISYKEATYSPTAVANGILNDPNEEQLECMKNVAENCFEPARIHFGIAFKVNSFFRSLELNAKIGGSSTSDHVNGKAIDFEVYNKVASVSNATVYGWMKTNIEYDQLIWEKGTDIEPDWIHVSYRESNNRMQEIRIK